jgi:hypothetical protein
MCDAAICSGAFDQPRGMEAGTQVKRRLFRRVSMYCGTHIPCKRPTPGIGIAARVRQYADIHPSAHERESQSHMHASGNTITTYLLVLRGGRGRDEQT